MSAISGLTSKSAVETLIQQTLASERKPITAFESQQKDLRSKLTIFTDFKGYLTALRDRMKNLVNTTSSPLTALRTAVSSKESIFTAKADKSASVGTHSIFVNQLASRDSGVSRRINDPENSTMIAKHFEGTTQSFTIAVGSGEAVTVSIAFNNPDETDASVMKRIRDGINEAGLGVAANYTKDTPTSARLTLTSADTGRDNAITLQDADGSALMQLAGFIDADGNRRQHDGGEDGGFLKSNSEDLNARFELNGLAIVRSSNVITDLLEGVTISLTGIQTPGSAPETLTIGRDTAAMREAIDKFVEDYNAVIKYINAKTSVDPLTSQRGALAGDFQVMNLRFQLRDAVTRSVAGLEPGLFSSLNEIGIDLDRQGVMSVKDADALTKALEENPSRVAEMFASPQGISAKTVSILDRFVNSGGIIDNSSKGVTNKIDYIQTQIKNYESRLAIREVTLRKEYADLQRALSQIQSQQSMLSNLFTGGGIRYQYGL